MGNDILNEYGSSERRIASFAQIASFMGGLCAAVGQYDKASAYAFEIQSWLLQRSPAAIPPISSMS